MARLYFVIFILISILSFSGCGRRGEVEPPVLFRVIPKEIVPANSSIIFIFEGRVRLKSLSIAVNNIKGKIEPLIGSHSDASDILWTPIQPLPLGKANISIKGEGTKERLPIKIALPLDITVVEPDHELPKLLESKAEEIPRTDIETKLHMNLKFSGPINIYKLKATIESDTDITSRASLYSEDFETIIASRTLKRKTNYTIKLENIVDLANNVGVEETISFITH